MSTSTHTDDAVVTLSANEGCRWWLLCEVKRLWPTISPGDAVQIVRYLRDGRQPNGVL